MGVVEIVSIVSAIISAGALGAVVVQIRSDSAYRRAEEEIRKAVLRKVFAKMVSAWVEQPGQGRLVVQNRADQPIYHVVARVVFQHGTEDFDGSDIEVHPADGSGDVNIVSMSSEAAALASFPEYVVPPGRYTVEIGPDVSREQSVLGVEIAFRDVRGLNWCRDSDGVLQEISVDPFEFMGVRQPFEKGKYVLIDGE